MLVKPRSVVVALAAAAALAACSSPKEKFEKCAVRCASFKSKLVKNICEGSCERKAYGDLDSDKLKGLCEKGDTRACLRFASVGDQKVAATVLESRCNANDKMCCGLLGRMLKDGKRVPKNKSKGYALMEKACKLGGANFCASPTLARMTKHEYKDAHTLASAGCDGGARWSCSLLGVMYRDGKGVSRDVSKAKKFFQKACDQGLKMSCRALRRL